MNEYLCNQIGQVKARYGPPVNFTRPEKSLCLSGFPDAGDPRYARALELIRLGQRNLAQHPRCDMPGFVPCEMHRRQREFLTERLRLNAQGKMTE